MFFDSALQSDTGGLQGEAGSSSGHDGSGESVALARPLRPWLYPPPPKKKLLGKSIKSGGRSGGAGI